MKYVYYDPPLKFSNILDPIGDKRASLQDIEKSEKEAWVNEDYRLVEIEYQLRFDFFPWFVDGIDGPEYHTKAMEHGGPTAVMFECLKRDMTVSELWWGVGTTNTHIDHPLNKEFFDVAQEKREEYISRIKKEREDILERQRQRQQTQHQQ